jgi:hypothetical protein
LAFTNYLIQLTREHLHHFDVSGTTTLKLVKPNIDSQMESTFFEGVLHDVFADLSVQARLVNLRMLEITSGYTSKPGATCYIYGEEDEDAPFPRNFLQLSLIPMKLISLKLRKL